MIIVAKLKAQEGKEANLEAELKEMVAKVASEEGTLTYTLHKSSNDPTLFMFYEKYKNAETYITICNIYIFFQKHLK